MIIDNDHPDDSTLVQKTQYANKTLKPDNQIRMYVMREAKAKLDISVRNHLRNAAALIGGEAIPTNTCQPSDNHHLCIDPVCLNYPYSTLPWYK